MAGALFGLARWSSKDDELIGPLSGFILGLTVGLIAYFDLRLAGRAQRALSLILRVLVGVAGTYCVGMLWNLTGIDLFLITATGLVLGVFGLQWMRHWI